MKKIRIAAFSLFLPLAALAGCGGTVQNLSLNANWYRNTALKSNLGGTLERLEYEVSFESAASGDFSLVYSQGVYRTELKNANLELDSEVREGYIYSTDLSISVQFKLGTQMSEVFQDTVHTEAQFLSAAEGLRPVRSFREVHSHVPANENPSSLESAYSVYDYTYTTEYDDALTTAQVALRSLTDGSSREDSFRLSSAGSFFDNEQILFALRGVDLATSPRFSSVNPIAGKIQPLAVEDVAPVSYEEPFEADGAEVSKVAAYRMTLGYQGANRGQPQTLIYAKTTDPSANAYRNVLLQLEAPILHTLGVMRYRLVKADFATK